MTVELLFLRLAIALYLAGFSEFVGNLVLRPIDAAAFRWILTVVARIALRGSSSG